MRNSDRQKKFGYGFEDKDRAEPYVREHDMAVSYLRQEHVARELVYTVPPPGHLHDVTEANRQVEVEIEKRVPAGWADLVIVANGDFLCKECGKIGEFETMTVVEVKIAPAATGDVMRQLKSYRIVQNRLPYERRPKVADLLVLAVRYDILPSDIDSLRNEGILVFQLGPSFERWMELERRKDPATLLEI